MYSEVFSTTLVGLSAQIVSVETDAGPGLPSFEMSGYLAAQVKEARERVRVAIRNSGIEIPPQRVVVNISPADIRKAGTGFDLPIAVGLLAANRKVDNMCLKNTVMIGELSLDGSVNSVNGILPSVIAAREQGFLCCIVPYDNLAEGAAVEGIKVFGVKKLSELIQYLNGQNTLAAASEKSAACSAKHTKLAVDFSDICGQAAAKRATLIAVAGMHNILYIGAPGSGKTMLAQRIPTIMPDLTFEEQLALTKIYSVAGKLNKDAPLIDRRPFRSPHHSITSAALLGGGRMPVPGEVTLAAKGVLFLDELTEFRPALLESLRQPLEDRVIRIIRLSQEYVYPADFMLAAAMNPCKCGYYPDRNRCRCSEQEIERYLGKISEPMWDRFDLNVQVQTVAFSQMVLRGQADEAYSSKQMRRLVCRARRAQLQRFAGTAINFNAQMTAGQVAQFCELGEQERALMEQIYTKMRMTVRGYHKVLKTARTIADIEGEKRISVHHLSEAVSYRSYGYR